MHLRREISRFKMMEMMRMIQTSLMMTPTLQTTMMIAKEVSLVQKLNLEVLIKKVKEVEATAMLLGVWLWMRRKMDLE